MLKDSLQSLLFEWSPLKKRGFLPVAQSQTESKIPLVRLIVRESVYGSDTVNSSKNRMKAVIYC